MSQTHPDETPQTLESFADHRHSIDLEVAVYVEGDLAHDPPLGNAAARHIASFLTDADEDVLRIDPEDASDDEIPKNVGTVLVTLPADPDETKWKPLQRRLLTRVPSGVDIVVLVDTDSVPWFCKDLADIRVVATGIDDPLEVYRVHLNPYSGKVYYRELEAFQGDSA